MTAARDNLTLTGQTLDGKYHLERVLGQGGMGAVYLATHVGTDRPVALKVIRPGLGARPEFLERFRREARAAGRLRHPNVVDVTDFGVAQAAGESVAYLVMEYLDGASLADVLKDEERLPVSWVVEILDEVCSAVHEAHQQGIVHRDLKPDNLWLEPNRRGGFTVKVLDFGLAKLGGVEPVAPAKRPASVADLETLGGAPPEKTPVAGEATVTHTPVADEEETRARPAPAPAGDTGELTRLGDVLGTPVYMSPEQCQGLPLDARTDVYSLGVIAYRMLAGEPPFGGDARALLRAHVAQRPRPLRERRRDVPQAVGDLVMSALDKDPQKRPPTAAAFAAALRARAEGVPNLLRSLLLVVGERLGVLARISALAHAPALAATLLVLVLGFFVRPPEDTALLAALGPDARPNTLPTFIVALTLSSPVFVALLLTAALCEAAVIRALVAPLRPIELRPLLLGFRRRLPAYLRTLAPILVVPPYLIVVLAIAEWRSWRGPHILAALVPVLAGSFWAMLHARSLGFLTSVMNVEGLSGRAALARSAGLARAATRDVPAVNTAALITIVVLAPIGLATGWAQGTLENWSTRPGQAIPGYSVMALGWLFSLPLTAIIFPLLSTALALLYCRTREAGGEPLSEILARFEKESLPPAVWEARMKDRVRERLRSGA